MTNMIMPGGRSPVAGAAGTGSRLVSATESAVRSLAGSVSALLLTVLMASAAWLRADGVTDERGSDSSEKSLMIILAISIGGVVTVAAGAYIASKTALFK